MDITYIFLGIFLIVLGVVIKHFKLYFLIAGYNTMSKEDKAKVNIAKAATLLRNVLVFMGLASILIGFSETLFDAPEIANYLFFPIVVGSVIFLLVKSNSQSYKN